MSGLDGTFGISATIFLTDVLLKGVLILFVTAIGIWALRRRSAATRYALWVFGLVTVLVLPAASVLLPKWTIPVFDVPLQLTTAAPVPAAFAPEIGAPGFAADANGVGEPTTGSAPYATFSRPTLHRQAPATQIPILNWIGIVWLVGAAVLVARLALDVIRTAAVTRSAALSGDSTPTRSARHVTNQLGIRREVRVVYGDLRMPAVWGFLQPVVVLPRDAVDWTWDRCRVVLMHELAHVKRCDCVFHLLTQFTCALNWPNPFVWLAAHRARAEQERSCDDIVLRGGTQSAEYASHLLDIARSASIGASSVHGALAMARESDLKRRMRAILDTSSNRAPLARRDMLMAGCAMALLGLPISGISVWSVYPEPRVVPAIWVSTLDNDRAIRTLHETALTHPDTETRISAIRTLHELDHDCDIVTQLVEAVNDPDRRVSEGAARTLAALNDPTAIARLASLSELARDPQVRAAAVLGLTGDRRTRAVNAIHRALRDRVFEVRLRAVQALSEIGDQRAAESLRCALWDCDYRIRLAAISALYVIDQRNET